MKDRESQSDWGLDAGWLVQYLQQEGVSCAEISQILSRDLDYSFGEFLAIDDYLRLFAWGADRLGAVHLGLDISEKLHDRDLGILGYLLQNSSTVGALCHSIEQYQSIFMRGMGFTFHKVGRELEVRWEICRPHGEGVRQDIEFSLATFLRILQLKIDPSFASDRANFSCLSVGPKLRYREVFGAEVHFEQRHNSLIFDIDLLQVPINDGDPKLLAILKEQADRLLLQLESHSGLVDQARFIIATSLEDEAGGMELLAKRLHTTSRTLNRRLAREGISYKALREDVIVEAAKQSLAETNVSLAIIASKLGYSESSSFVRAFKRLTGVTPKVYRDKARRKLI